MTLQQIMKTDTLTPREQRSLSKAERLDFLTDELWGLDVNQYDIDRALEDLRMGVYKEPSYYHKARGFIPDETGEEYCEDHETHLAFLELTGQSAIANKLA